MPEMPKPDLETMFETPYDRVWKYAYTILLSRENAEDVAEAFLAAYAAYTWLWLYAEIDAAVESIPLGA